MSFMVNIGVKEKSIYAASRKRIRKMLEYFENKKVAIRYVHDNSLGHQYVREYTGKYDSFDIINEGTEDFNVILYKNNNVVFEQDFDVYWEFCGLGKMQMRNSGPYCYFTIKRKFLFFNWDRLCRR